MKAVEKYHGPPPSSEPRRGARRRGRRARAVFQRLESSSDDDDEDDDDELDDVDNEEEADDSASSAGLGDSRTGSDADDDNDDDENGQHQQQLEQQQSDGAAGQPLQQQQQQRKSKDRFENNRAFNQLMQRVNVVDEVEELLREVDELGQRRQHGGNAQQQQQQQQHQQRDGGVSEMSGGGSDDARLTLASTLSSFEVPKARGPAARRKNDKNNANDDDDGDEDLALLLGRPRQFAEEENLLADLQQDDIAEEDDEEEEDIGDERRRNRAIARPAGDRAVGEHVAAPLGNDNEQAMGAATDGAVQLAVNSKMQLTTVDNIDMYLYRGVVDELPDDLSPSGCDFQLEDMQAGDVGQYWDWMQDVCYYEFLAIFGRVKRKGPKKKNNNNNNVKTPPRLRDPDLAQQVHGNGRAVLDNYDAASDDDDDDYDDPFRPARPPRQPQQQVDAAPNQQEQEGQQEDDEDDNDAESVDRGVDIDPDDDDDDVVHESGHLFARPYAARLTHMLAVLNEYRIPRPSGKVPRRTGSRNSMKQLDELARWIGVLFCPWSRTRPPAVRCFDDLKTWYLQLDIRCPRQAGIHAVVTRMLTDTSSAYTKKMLTSQRLKFAGSRTLRNRRFVDRDVVPETANERRAIDEAALRAQQPKRAHTLMDDKTVLNFYATVRYNEPPVAVATIDTLRRQVRPAMTDASRRLHECIRDRRDTRRAGVKMQAIYDMRNGDDAHSSADDDDDVDAQPAWRPLQGADRVAAAEAVQRALEQERQNRFAQLHELEHKLNKQQRRVYNHIVEQLIPRVAPHLLPDGVDAAAARKPFHLHIQGWPGVGKSFVIRVLSAWVQAHAREPEKARPIISAYTGFAASHIGGMTLHRSLAMHAKLENMPAGKKKVLRDRVRDAGFFLIDEISFVGAQFFCRVIRRIEQLLVNEFGEPGPRFGDADFPALILVGDFAQLPSVGDMPLFTSLDTVLNGRNREEIDKTIIEAARGTRQQQRRGRGRGGRGGGRGRGGGAAAAAAAAGPRRLPPLPASGMWSMKLAGLLIFSKFDTMQLTKQVRAAKCPKQAKLVDYMVKNGKLPDILNPESEYFVDQLSPASSAEDIERFRFAPILTGTNARRRALNYGQGVSFAQRRGVPYIVWQKRVADKFIDKLPAEVLDDPSSVLHTGFVAGAPCTLGVNVVPHLCVCNGTSAVFHSLTWEDDVEMEANLARIAMAGPGETVEVECPSHVNVTIMSSHHLPLDLVDHNDNVIASEAATPAQRAAAKDPESGFTRYLLPMRLWKQLAKFRDTGKNDLEMPEHESHMVELG